jgi:hypothetical protein
MKHFLIITGFLFSFSLASHAQNETQKVALLNSAKYFEIKSSLNSSRYFKAYCVIFACSI